MMVTSITWRQASSEPAGTSLAGCFDGIEISLREGEGPPPLMELEKEKLVLLISVYEIETHKSISWSRAEK